MDVPVVAITQRVTECETYSERRDALDQKWSDFFASVGLLPLILPNATDIAMSLVARVQPCGFILSGGNDLTRYGGDAPERDALEQQILSYADAHRLPVIGVCRGMQVLLDAYDVSLHPVDNHVATTHVLPDGRQVNSFHTLAATSEDVMPFEVVTRHTDGVVEAIKYEEKHLHGMMWHPERCTPYARADIELFRQVFGGKGL